MFPFEEPIDPLTIETELLGDIFQNILLSFEQDNSSTLLPGKDSSVRVTKSLTHTFWLGVTVDIASTSLPTLIGAMVGCKSDFREDRSVDTRAAVQTSEAEGLAKELDLKHFEASSVI